MSYPIASSTQTLDMVLRPSQPQCCDLIPQASRPFVSQSPALTKPSLTHNAASACRMPLKAGCTLLATRQPCAAMQGPARASSASLPIHLQSSASQARNSLNYTCPRPLCLRPSPWRPPAASVLPTVAAAAAAAVSLRSCSTLLGPPQQQILQS